MGCSRWAAKVVCATCVTVGLTASAPPGPSSPISQAPSAAAPEKPLARDGSAPLGLVVRLSDAELPARTATETPPPDITRLSDGEARALLDRLPPLPAAGSGVQAAAIPDRSLPPPRPGRTIAVPFPPAGPGDVAPAPAAGPLAVLRHAPDGDVSPVFEVSVTFSQPMVAVTSQADIARVPIPVKLWPQPPGEWRWIGTRTVIFEPSGGRLPMASRFQAEVPAGTASAAGAKLGRAERWTFSTPAPTVVSFLPGGDPIGLTPVMLAVFDQKVDAEAVLATVRIRAGAASPRLRLATKAEIEADAAVRERIREARAGHWVAFRSESPLPAGADVSVAIGPGTPSAEGPKVTANAREWHLATRGPMRVTRATCDTDRCRPLESLRVEFSNPIDEDRFADDMVRIDPPIDAALMRISGRILEITGATSADTTYTVTLSTGLRDIFGAALEEPRGVSIRTGPDIPMLWSSGMDEMAVVDASSALRFPVYSTGCVSLDVRIYAVTPENWPAFVRSGWPVKGAAVAPRFRTRLAVQGDPGRIATTWIDLRPALAGGIGHVVLAVDPAPIGSAALERPRPDHVDVTPSPQGVRVWIQATRIGLDAFADGGQLVAWASSLLDGRPLSGAHVTLLPAPARVATTDSGGLARLPLNPAPPRPARAGGARWARDERPPSWLVARAGKDVAILPGEAWRNSLWWRKAAAGDALIWSVFDDRTLYRPGEEVRVKGWLRIAHPGAEGGIEPVEGRVKTVSYAAHDSAGDEIGRGTATLNRFGGFDFALKLPAAPSLGDATLTLDGDGAASHAPFTHAFSIQEFRRPEFAVTATPSAGPHVVGEHATVAVEAAYYTGGPLASALVEWDVRSFPAYFTPPNRDEFSFESEDPAPRDWNVGLHSARRERHGGPARHSARTDDSGRHTLRIDFESVSPARPMSVDVTARVQDVNRQAWGAGATLLVHPSAVYVGLRSDRYFVARGDPLDVDAIVTDLDGAAVPGRPVRILAERLSWKQEKREWIERPIESRECAIISGEAAARCTFAAPTPGNWRVTATVADDRGRPNVAQLRRWVAGMSSAPVRSPDENSVTLVADRKEYRGGETAAILVVPPFAPAEGLMTIRRDGIVRAERFRIGSGSLVLRVPIDEQWVPDVTVQVDLVGAKAGETPTSAEAAKAPSVPAFASGSVDLMVPPRSRTLGITVAPRDAILAPGHKTTIGVEVRDANGAPVDGAEVAVVVVDEAILALANRRRPDPVGDFYRPGAGDVSDHHLRRRLVFTGPRDVMEAAGRVEGGSRGGIVGGVVGGVVGGLLDAPPASSPGPPPPPPPPPPRTSMATVMTTSAEVAEWPAVTPRTNFTPLALFAPGVRTGANGHADVAMTLPDNLTRYRIIAVAATAGVEFGTGESAITASLPLMARASPPRLLNFGDRIELPIAVQNLGDTPADVTIAVRAANATLTDGAGRRVEVPAGGRVEVRFPLATGDPGSAAFQVMAASKAGTDSSEFSVPIRTPATTEAFAAYGHIDEGAIAQPVAAPSGTLAGFGGLELATSSTALQALSDAVLYLVSYPYECAEQRASRVLGIVALGDVLDQLGGAGLPDRATVEASARRDIVALEALQNDDGGFALWRRGQPSWPFLSVHVTHAIERARTAGLRVDNLVLRRARGYVDHVDARIPKEYSDNARYTVLAYSQYVRKLAGRADPAGARSLVRRAGPAKLPIEAMGWLFPVLSGDSGSSGLAAELRTELLNRVSETAGAAHFVTSWPEGRGVLFSSDRRVDAVVLDGLIGDRPSSELVPKIVEGLLAHRQAGRWESTQENCFVLLALSRYFHAYEKTAPDFVARAWLGDGYLGEQAFRGRSAVRRELTIPMRELGAQEGVADLVLSKDGPGRLYYRIGLRYAPKTRELAALDRGFAVQREYAAIDDPGDVRRDASGAWHVRAGARVRVRLTMVAPDRRYHVALVDPLPAGLEALNPALPLAGTVPGDEAEDDGAATDRSGRPEGWWFGRPIWFDHQNLRDDRVEAFASLLREGVYTYNYVARATTPGEFVVPPPKAEEMYSPETFGRGASDRVIIEVR